MKFLVASALAGAVLAQKSGFPSKEKMECADTRKVQNDILNGSKAGCKDIVFIMARASTEKGNMGCSMGPKVCDLLKKGYPNRVACQGVGGAYKAGLMDNVGAQGTTTAAIKEAANLFEKAATDCPKAVLVFGGYSQGTAVMLHAVGETIKPATKARTVGGVLFGYTKNKQTGGTIKGYPRDQVKVFCDKNDGVCGGGLNVNAGHFVYPNNGDGDRAFQFLKSKIDPALGKSGKGKAAKSIR